MPYNFTVSPDFNPSHLSGWFIFNTWLQKALGEGIHLELYNDFADQRSAIAADTIDLIYANPYDASMLVREKGFLPIASPHGKSDEAVIVVKKDSAINEIEDLQPGIRIASTDDPDVHLMCMIMLEPADLDRDNTQIGLRDTYVLIAKDLLGDAADVGFFLQETFADLSEVVRKELRIIAASEIHVIRHVLLAGPKLAHKHEAMQQLLSAMTADDKGRDVLENLGFSAWEVVDQEATEFMIDLMDTLET